jgi:hypothetical protein
MTPISRLPPSYIRAPSDEDTTPPPSYRASIQQKPPLDLSQRFEKNLAEYNASQNILKRWLFEIVSLTLSAICMVSIPRLPSIWKSSSIPQSKTDGPNLGSHNRHMRSHQGPASQRVATSFNCPKRTVQNCVGRPHTSNFRSYRSAEMGLVPRQRIKRHDRLRDI